MKNEVKGNNLYWKNLEADIQVGHFCSHLSDGSKVYVKRFQAQKNEHGKNATIYLLHDIGQYHGRFLDFIKWSQKNNPYLSFVAMDFVGHGLSSGTRGHIHQFDYLVQDFLLLLNQTHKKSGEKWYVLGHGLGGLVTLDLMNRFQEKIDACIDGIILSNFILKFGKGLTLFKREQALLPNFFLGLLSQARPLKIMQGSQILTDTKSILAYEHDPLVIQEPTLVTLKEVQRKTSNIYQDAYFLGKPVLMLRSERSHAINSEGIDYFIKGIKKELLTQKKYSLMKHDLYNEQDREIVFSDIMDWIRSYEN